MNTTVSISFTILPRVKKPRSPPLRREGHSELAEAISANLSGSLAISAFLASSCDSVFSSYPLSRMCDARATLCGAPREQAAVREARRREKHVRMATR